MYYWCWEGTYGCPVHWEGMYGCPVHSEFRLLCLYRDGSTSAYLTRSKLIGLPDLSHLFTLFCENMERKVFISISIVNDINNIRNDFPKRFKEWGKQVQSGRSRIQFLDDVLVKPSLTSQSLSGRCMCPASSG